MQRYYFTEDSETGSAIHFGTVEPLIEWLDFLEDDEDAILYFSSGGGRVSASYELTRALDAKPNVLIRLVGIMASAAFDVVMNSKNKVGLSPFFEYAMIHKSNSYVGTRELSSKVPNESTILNKMDSRLRSIERKSIRYLNEEERALFEDGQDVFLDYTRVREMLVEAGKL